MLLVLRGHYISKFISKEVKKVLWRNGFKNGGWRELTKVRVVFSSGGGFSINGR
jgi:hypothetical protein